MGGFVVNYEGKHAHSGFNEKDVMHFFVPSSLPVTSWLAQNFASCDQWYGSAPTQTFANRMFAQCANPGVPRRGASRRSRHRLEAGTTPRQASTKRPYVKNRSSPHGPTPTTVSVSEVSSAG